MAKPHKHGDKWRVRWVDASGGRQSAVFDDYKIAQTELRRKQVEAAEIKRGIRNAPPPEKTLDELCDYWLEKRAPRKRSQKDDISIIKQLRAKLGSRKLRDIGIRCMKRVLPRGDGRAHRHANEDEDESAGVGGARPRVA